MNNVDFQPNKLFGIFRGKVVQHLENGILKVFIPDVYAPEFEFEPSKLPDAEMAVPIFGGNNNGNGVFSYPNIGTYVICQFLNGDQNLPIVMGCTQGGSFAAMKYNEVANELDPSTGQTPSCIHMMSIGRSKIKLYEGGQIEMCVNGKSEKSAKFIIDQNGNVMIQCDGVFQVLAENIKMYGKNQVAEFSGNNIIVQSKDALTLGGKNVITLCPQGVATVQSKYRMTNM